MIEQNTVFILGAGASCPYNYLSGKGLRKDIWKNFSSNYKTFVLKPWQDKLEDQQIEIYLKPINEFIDKFYFSSTQSIDLFLSRNPKYKELGQLAITLTMFQSEQQSLFREKLDNEKHDWYLHILNTMTRKFIRKDSCIINENKISFITFNYDRSLENFLYESLINSFTEISPEIIETQLRKIPFIHMYGQIAPLPWQNHEAGIPYKSNLNELDPTLFTENIRVIYEERDNSMDSTIKQARDIIESAERIFFLGFGYAEENLELLKIRDLLHGNQRVYGTVLGLTDREINRIKGIFEFKIVLKAFEDMDCLALLRKYL